MFIYKITNKINKKAYIGQTTQKFQRRMSEHFSPSSTYCRILHRAILKYGKENFEMKIISTATTLDELNKQEEFFIVKENTLVPFGYNLLKGGNNKRHHPETCAKMSATRKGKKIPALSYPRGKYPPEWCAAISKAKKGRPSGMLGRKFPGLIRPHKRKAVIALNHDGSEHRKFISIKEASQFFKIHHSNIVAVIRGRREYSGGLRWKYDSIIK